MAGCSSLLFLPRRVTIPDSGSKLITVFGADKESLFAFSELNKTCTTSPTVIDGGVTALDLRIRFNFLFAIISFGHLKFQSV